MSFDVIQEAIFKSIDVIIEKRLKQLSVNYCVEGIVDSAPEYDEKGEMYFWVNYQDLKIKAYPVSAIHQKENEISFTDNDNTIVMSDKSIYKKGDLVYTLIINGDLSKRRLILCKV